MLLSVGLDDTNILIYVGGVAINRRLGILQGYLTCRQMWKRKLHNKVETSTQDLRGTETWRRYTLQNTRFKS